MFISKVKPNRDDVCPDLGIDRIPIEPSSNNQQLRRVGQNSKRPRVRAWHVRADLYPATRHPKRLICEQITAAREADENGP
jgi:hypothetical protein